MFNLVAHSKSQSVFIVLIAVSFLMPNLVYSAGEGSGGAGDAPDSKTTRSGETVEVTTQSTVSNLGLDYSHTETINGQGYDVYSGGPGVGDVAAVATGPGGGGDDYQSYFDQYSELQRPSMNNVQCNSNNTVTLSWGSVSRADVYTPRLDNPENNTSACLDGWHCNGQDTDYLSHNISGTSVTVPVLGGVNYSWWVHAKYSDTWEGVSSYNKETFVCPLATPTKQSPVCNNNGTVTLRWGGVSGADEYPVRIKPTNGGSEVANNGESDLVQTFSVTPGVEYEWWVHAKKAGTWDGVSEAPKSTFTCPPARPTGLTASCAPNSQGVVLDWSDVSNADVYALRIQEYGDPSTRTTDDNVSISQDVFTILPNQEYEWWVHAIAGGEWSDLTSHTFTCQTNPQCDLLSVSPTTLPASGGSVNVEWQTTDVYDTMSLVGTNFGTHWIDGSSNPDGNRNYTISDTTTFTLGGSSFDGSNSCSPVTVTVQDPPLGSISGNDCTIAVGENSCTAHLTWDLTRNGDTRTSYVRNVSTNSIIRTNDDDASNYGITIPHGATNVALRLSTENIAQTQISASCTSGTNWNGSQCIPNCVANVGNSCTSSANSCGMTNSGTISCDGSCSATTPSNGSCPADPTVNLEVRAIGQSNWNDTTVAISGTQQVELRWSSTSAVSCTATAGSGFSTGNNPNGIDSSITEPSAGNSSTYSIRCQNSLGVTATDSVTVSKATPPPSAPTVTLESRVNSGSYSASNRTINSSDVVGLRWTTTNATNCYVYGSPNGLIISPSTQVNYYDNSINEPSAGNAYTYGVRCVNSAGDQAIDTLTVTANHIQGCTDNAANNYSALATQDDGSCTYDPVCVANVGNSCTSSANSCGMTNSGTISCDGSCSATTPSNGSCPALPTVDLRVRETNVGAYQNSITIDEGDQVQLNWTSTNAVSCVATAGSGFSTANQTNYTDSTIGEPGAGSMSTYSIRCTNSVGDQVNDSVTVTTRAPAVVTDPTVNLQGRVIGTSVWHDAVSFKDTEQVELRWVSTGASSCNAQYGDGFYVSSVNGTDSSISEPSTVGGSGRSFGILCQSSSGGYATDQVVVTRAANTPGVPTVSLEVRLNYGTYSTANQTIGSTDTVQLRWRSTNANSCEVYGTPNGLIVSGTNYHDNSINEPPAGQTYTYGVRCYNSIGQSAIDTVSVTRPADPVVTGGDLTIANIDPTNGGSINANLYYSFQGRITYTDSTDDWMRDNFRSRLEFDYNNDGNPDRIEGERTTTSDLDPDGVNTTVVGDSVQLPAGNYRYRWVTDTRNDVLESNDSNNTSAWTSFTAVSTSGGYLTTSPRTCYIPEGSNRCSFTMNWLVNGSGDLKVRSNYRVGNFSNCTNYRFCGSGFGPYARTGVAGSYSGNAIYGRNNVRAHLDNSLVYHTYTDARCDTGLTWNGSVCAGPAPTVTIAASVNGGSQSVTDPRTIDPGDDVTIHWTSTNAVSCVETAGSGLQVSGTNNADPTINEPAEGTSDTYTIECENSSGTTADDSITITTNTCDVNMGNACGSANSCGMQGAIQCGGSCSATPPDSMCSVPLGDDSLRINDPIIRKGNDTTLTWDIGTNANCTLSGPGLTTLNLTQANPTGTTVPVTVNGPHVYTLDCGSDSISKQVRVIADIFET